MISPVRKLLLAVLSPTRLAFELLKQTRADPTAFARHWPTGWITTEALIAVALAVASADGSWRLTWPFTWLTAWLSLSRIIEITVAYYRDAIDTIEGKEKSTRLEPVDRIRLVVRSYMSLIIDWAVLFFAFPLAAFETPLGTFVDAIYFSGVTLTTLGYGDIHPAYAATKLLSVCEALVGILVLVVAVSSYLAAAGKSRG